MCEYTITKVKPERNTIMRILCWNAHCSKGSKTPKQEAQEQRDKIWDFLSNYDKPDEYDIIALQEIAHYPDKKESLTGKEVLFPKDFIGSAGVCTIVSEKLEQVKKSDDSDLKQIRLSGRWKETKVSIGGKSLVFTNVYIPYGERFDKEDGVELKKQFWDKLIAFAGNHKDENVIICGDFNTDETQAGGFCTEYIKKLREEGWKDLIPINTDNYRTYFCKDKDNEDKLFARLDYIFVSKSMEEYNPVLRYERPPVSPDGKVLSDHMMLIVDITL
jgi:exonuclease III